MHNPKYLMFAEDRSGRFIRVPENLTPPKLLVTTIESFDELEAYFDQKRDEDSLRARSEGALHVR